MATVDGSHTTAAINTAKQIPSCHAKSTAISDPGRCPTKPPVLRGSPVLGNNAAKPYGSNQVSSTYGSGRYGTTTFPTTHAGEGDSSAFWPATGTSTRTRPVTGALEHVTDYEHSSYDNASAWA